LETPQTFLVLFMKRLFYLILFVCSNAQASADLFSIDELKIEAEFTQLSQLEIFLIENPVTFSELTLLSENFDFSNLSGQALIQNFQMLNGGDRDMNILSFCAGFCCGVPGIAFVFFVSEENPSYTKSAILGGLLVYLFMFFFLFASSWGSYYIY
jgi:hypothetical protein